MNTITNDITRTLAGFRALPGFDGFVKLLASLLLLLFVLNALSAYAHTGRWVFLAVLIGETLTVVIYLAARRPTQVDTSLSAGFSTALATFYFMAFDLESGIPILPILGVTLQIAGLAWQIVAKLTLGRSFGMLPAVRGLVTGGPYRIVRHPIYLGYFVAHIGFLLGAFSLKNACLLIGLYLLQAVRIGKEEQLLAQSPAYLTYRANVRWRVLPGVY